MRILFDIGHPSFVHLFKNAAFRSIEKGNEILFAYRDKDKTGLLLKELKLPALEAGKNYSGKILKLLGLLINSRKLYKITKRFDPDVILSGASPYASLINVLLHKTHFIFDDTENREQVLLYKNGATLIVTPESFSLELGKKHIRYPGLHELAYLPENASQNKVKKNKPLVFFRFVSWTASHDTFRQGLNDKQKETIVTYFAGMADVVISSELELPNPIKKYAYKGSVEKIHRVLAVADLYIGESATMASEAACLNVPAIYFDPVGRSYTDFLENKYGLVSNFRCNENDFLNGFAKAKELIKIGNQNNSYTNFLKSQIDVSSFMDWLLDNYSQAALSRDSYSPEFFKRFQRVD